ncbi:phage distal tail protein, Rcc01695 family [Methyloceanibacter sp.]|uniref:phage distal tail protein, Rcc01695 family n=1 Tax=Methyloceanibacter sp. TaxID=1965321 RepID=UPI003D6D2A4C
MAFHEVRFPAGISLGATGGPERRTEIVVLGSGAEERNSRWADSKRSYNAGYGIKRVDDLHAVIEFFEERRGRLHGFRWKDWSDYKSCPPSVSTTALDQAIGTGNGVNATFQLAKTYGSAFNPWAREIKKPVAGSVRVAVAGVEKTAGTHFNVDHATGVVTFTGGNIPTMGQAVTAGFEFDVPVRFDTDRLEVNLSLIEAGSIPDIPIVEIRL